MFAATLSSAMPNPIDTCTLVIIILSGLHLGIVSFFGYDLRNMVFGANAMVASGSAWPKPEHPAKSNPHCAGR